VNPSVLFIDETSDLGGGEVVLTQMANALRSAGWVVGVALPNGGPLAEILQGQGVEVLVVPRPRLISTSFYVRQQWKVPNPFSLLVNIVPASLWTLRLSITIARRRPAIVHTVSLWSHACASLAAFLVRVPVVWHVQDLVQPGRASGLYARLFRQWAKWWPTRILCVSDAVAAQFGKGAWVKKKVHVLWNVVDLCRYAPGGPRAAAHAGGPLTIGTAARLTPWKGQDECLEAAWALQDRGVDFEWRFAGTEALGTRGYAGHLARRAAELGLADRVQWLGWVENMPEFYRGLDVLVHLPTEPDPCPLVLMEAAASGVPLISTGGGSADRIVPGAAGSLVPGRSPGKVAQVLENWAGSPETLQERGRQARAFAEAHFDLSKYAGRLVAEYMSILGDQ
jgi:glycosyltransferase involved in cell wall biosynthesis